MKWLRWLYLLCAWALLLPFPALAEPSFVCGGFEVATFEPRAGKIAQSTTINPHHEIHALVVFADFDDAAEPTNKIPTYSSALFDRQRAGSLSHFYETMSFGQFKMTGTVLPRRYVAARPAAVLQTEDRSQRGPYGEFVKDLIAAMDGDVDFGDYDNDGPDGLPNSGDDDGVVDYLFIAMRSVPRGFIAGGATGIAGLGIFQDFKTTDRQPDGKLIRIGALARSGSIMAEGSFSKTVGVMAHEFGHALGLPDLYDLSYTDPVTDSAGIGKWGLMGWGAHGWNGGDGPVGFSAWTLERLGWVGRDNRRLVELTEPQELEAQDLFAGGKIYKIHLPSRSRTVVSASTGDERLKVDPGYLLLEARSKTSHYYNRGLPGEGLLVWRVKPGHSSNAVEGDKAVDLVCADGLFAAGGVTDEALGWDDLDFWAHDAEYARANGGNQGDAGDLFDGVRYRRFDRVSNPSIASVGDFISPALSGLVLEVRRVGEALRLKVEPPRWAGTIEQRVHWAGVVVVDGDVEVAPAGGIEIRMGTEVRFAGGDRLAAGLDPALSELRIEGDFFSNGPLSNNNQPISLAGIGAGVEWYGLVVDPTQSGKVDFPEGGLLLRDARIGMVMPGAPPGVYGLTLSGVDVFDGNQGDSAGNSDGHLAPGEAVQLVVEMDNWSLTTFRGMEVEVRWDNPWVNQVWGGTQRRHISSFSVTPGGRRQVVLPALLLDQNTPPGESVQLSVNIRQGRTLKWSEQIDLQVADFAPLPPALLAPVNREVYDGTVTISRAEGVSMQLAEDGQVVAADMIVYDRAKSQVVAEVPMRRVGGHYQADFAPAERGAYVLAARVSGAAGAVGYLSDRLDVDVLFDEWAPVLVVANDQSVRPRGAWNGIADHFAAELGRRGLALNRLDHGQVDQITPALLSRYIGDGRLVVWLGMTMGGESKPALTSYMDGGGNLFISSLRFHLGMGAEIRTRLPFAAARTANPAALSGRSRELAIASTFYARLSDLVPTALPILFDDEGAVAGLLEEKGARRLVYYALDLYQLAEEERQKLLDTGLDFLTASREGPQLFIRDVAGVEALASLGRIAPTIKVENLGLATAPPFAIWYEVHGERGPLALRRKGEPALLPGEVREISMPGWTIRREGQYAVKLAIRDPVQGTVFDKMQRPFEAVDVQGRFATQASVEDTLGNGAAFFDYDADGDLDFYLVRLEGANRLYRNDGGIFVERAGAAGLDDGGRGRALALGDYDSDGDLDLYLVNERTTSANGSNRFFQNQGTGRFIDNTLVLDADPQGGVSLADANSGRSAGFFDYDSDGDLDLYLLNAVGGDDSANRLFRNDAGLFADKAQDAGLADVGSGRGMAIGDYDNDGDPDLYIANQTGRIRDQFYRNDLALSGDFAPVGQVLGVGFETFEVGAVFGDVDGDGDLDLFVSNERNGNALWRNDGRRVAGVSGLADIRYERLAEDRLGRETVGAAFFDYDNDGDLDLATTAINRAAGGEELYHNRGGGDLVPAGSLLGLRRESAGRGLSWGDYDGDGRQDLLVADASKTILYRNEIVAAPWLRVELQGEAGNLNALGARIELSADGRKQVRELQSSYGYSSQVQPWMHFGLGGAVQVDSLRVFWPGGEESVATNIGNNQRLVLSHPVSAFKAAVSAGFALGRSYPNPFNAETVIPFDLAKPGRVRLEIFNIAGQRVRVLFDERREGGRYKAVWDGRDAMGRAVGSGVYFYRLHTDGQVASRSVLLLK